MCDLVWEMLSTVCGDEEVTIIAQIVGELFGNIK